MLVSMLVLKRRKERRKREGEREGGRTAVLKL
jgi:hypothetical protein